MLDDLADGQVWSSAALPAVNMPVCVVCVTGGGQHLIQIQLLTVGKVNTRETSIGEKGKVVLLRKHQPGEIALMSKDHLQVVCVEKKVLFVFNLFY